MSDRITVVTNAILRPLIEPRLPDWADAHFFASRAEALDLAPLAEVGWFDMEDNAGMAGIVEAATKLKWLNSIFSGLDFLPLDLLQQRGVTVTNGAGINALTIAEYVVMGMLNVAKGYPQVLRAAERKEWLLDSPGKRELAGSKALLLGFGAIGQLIKPRLEAFDVDVTVVRRTPSEGVLTPDQWRDRLGDFDWVILVVPATPETDGMIGEAELAAMKNDAVLLNFARGAVVDQSALTEALKDKQIGAAWLDVTTPEPLPADDPLWSLDNAHISMHLSGRAQDKMFMRSADRFIENLTKWQAGEPVAPQLNLELGY